MAASASIVWFRQDLRLTDNPALARAIDLGEPVVPLYIWAPEEEGDWAAGAASRWWLHHSLASLAADLRTRGSNLILRKGGSLGAIKAIARQTGAARVLWNRRYEPASTARDARIQEQLTALGLQCESFNGSLLFEPWDIRNQSGRPFQVFTPFWRACLARADAHRPSPAPARVMAPRDWCCSLDLADLELAPPIDWAAGLRETWVPGENGALAHWEAFLASGAETYATDRDRPDLLGTSRLSPHLHFGEISPRLICSAIVRAVPVAGPEDRQPDGAEAFLRELGWREFAHHLLYHAPQTPSAPLRPEFAEMPWRRDPAGLHAWQRGKTGFPLVDAGMRELWHTGWMHNRVRMVVASFLVKDLLISWQEGARWFWDTLVDADLANNTLGWQWVAGCGADAAPFFRVFNPVTQGEKFDPDGAYVRKWVPELSRMPSTWIHKPWAAPAGILGDAGVRLEVTYPLPIVDHAAARHRALAAFEAIRFKAE